VAFFGILFKEQITRLFESPILALIALFGTALIMWSSRYAKETPEQMNWFHALLVGFAQTFAVIPGISRSGSTIVTALWLGINRETAARFSFLLSIPVIMGASILKFNELIAAPPHPDDLLNLILGTIAAAISGYFAIIWLLDIIRKQKLEWFGLYCAIVSLLGILIFSLKN
jgi:undecaprenyl-diphosphatase